MWKQAGRFSCAAVPGTAARPAAGQLPAEVRLEQDQAGSGRVLTIVRGRV
jgi:hypothetical protein